MMTEVWKSNENKFCKYCKCWVADNKVSWAGHEQGARHKKAVEEKLSDMKRKAVSDMKSAKDEAHWLRKMEEAALKDYKSKDISNNRFEVKNCKETFYFIYLQGFYSKALQQ